MAIARSSPLVTSISGKIGGTQFVSTAGGLHVRSRPCRRSTPTVALMDSQALHASMRLAWLRLLDSQRLYYRRLALQMTATDRLAQSRRPSAYQLFYRYQSRWLRAAPGVSAQTPVAKITDQPTSVQLGFTDTPYYFIQVNYPYVTPFKYCALYGAVSFRGLPPPSSATHKYFGSFQIAATPTEVSAQWLTVLPALQPWQHYSVRLVCQAPTYFAAAPVYATGQCQD